MLKWLAPLIVFGLVVFVHELGHFLAAKFMRVYAPVFAFGWGRRLWGFRRGETDYRISWFPVGGFVAMATKDSDSVSAIEGGVDVNAAPDDKEIQGHQRGFNPIPFDPEALKPFGPKPVPPERWVESKPLWGKLLILSAGVIMNALLAVGVGIGGVMAYGRTFGGQFATVEPNMTAVIDSVVPGMPAAIAGMRAGDSIVTVAGKPVTSWAAVVSEVAGSPGVPVEVSVVHRDGTSDRLVITPEAVRADSQSNRMIGRMGVFSAQHLRHEPATFGQAISDGLVITGRMGTEVLRVVKGLFTGAVSVKQLGGPLRIAQVSYEVAKTGLEPLLVLIAFLSMNLAVLNLLPIPVLDGGQIVVRLIEAAKGSALSERTQEYLMRFGVLVILALFVLVNFNDIVSFLS